VETTPGPPEHEKLCIDVSRPEHTRMHHMTQRSHRIKKQFWCNVSHRAFYGIRTVPRRTKMHYVTRRSHRMQKHMFDIMYPDALFVETIPSPPEQEKLCIDVSCPGCTRTPYVAHRSQRMQKHKFDIMDPSAFLWKRHQAKYVVARFLWKLHRAHPSMKNCASMFRTLVSQKWTTWPEDRTGCKNTSSL
jgi:hypothetical protein